jgi:hypothetical protein
MKPARVNPPLATGSKEKALGRGRALLNFVASLYERRQRSQTAATAYTL